MSKIFTKEYSTLRLCWFLHDANVIQVDVFLGVITEIMKHTFLTLLCLLKP